MKKGLICQWVFHILHIQHIHHIWHIQCIVHICHIQHILHILHIQDICSTHSDKWFVKASSSQTKMRIKARPTCPDNDCPEVLMLEPVQPPAPLNMLKHMVLKFERLQAFGQRWATGWTGWMRASPLSYWDMQNMQNISTNMP